MDNGDTVRKKIDVEMERFVQDFVFWVSVQYCIKVWRRTIEERKYRKVYTSAALGNEIIPGGAGA